MTYPASLRQQAAWIREALNPATPETQCITLGDVDVEELEAAADRIEQLEERMRGADALIVLWETRATRAEARVEKLEAALRMISSLWGAGTNAKQVALDALAPEQDR